MKNFLLLVTGICIGFYSCRKTPSSNYLPKPLGEEAYPPWDAPVYTYEQMLSLFPTEDYSGLNEVFVATNGSDETGDGSIGNPYKTIQHAADQHTEAGTIINVRAGIYQENVLIENDGSFGQPYVLYSYDGIGTAKIDGNMEGDKVVQLAGLYNILDGFEIYNGGRYCVLITRNIPEGNNPFGGEDSYAVVRNNIVHTAVQDVVKCGHLNFVLIEKNDISGSLSEKQNDQCIDGVGVYHSLCHYNYLHDNGDGGGGYFKGGSANNIWCFNLIKDMKLSGIPEYSAFGIQAGGSGQFSYRDQAWTEYPAGYEQWIYSNIFINCQGCAITVESSWNTKIYNNTSYNCGYASSTDITRNAIFRTKVSSGNTDNKVRSQDLEIRNNIAYNDSDHPVAFFFSQLSNELASVTNDYNCFYNANGIPTWNFPNGATATNFNDDPLFNDPVNCDFSLLSGSPCLDAGENINAVTKGVASNNCMYVTSVVNRPVGAITDIGAYEQ